MIPSRPNRLPKNARPSPCAIERRSNASTKKYARDSSEAPPQQPPVPLPRAVEPRPNNTRAGGKGGVAVMAEETATITAGTRGIPLVHRGNRDSSTTQGPLPGKPRPMARGKRDLSREIEAQMTPPLPDSRSVVREVRMLVGERVSDLAVGVPGGVNQIIAGMHHSFYHGRVGVWQHLRLSTPNSKQRKKKNPDILLVGNPSRFAE